MSFTPLLRGLLPALCLFLLACNNDDTADRPRLRVTLTDSPGDYEKVIVDVIGVEARIGEDAEFIALDENYGGRYDLLELTNGLDTLIAVSSLPAGELTEIRLLLGDSNFVQIDSQLIALSTPSAQQSGLKIKLTEATLEPGNSYLLVLDFDAGRSVVKAGNSGKYNLKPVIRGTVREVAAEEAGRIGGMLTPAERQYVFAYTAGGDTLSTYANDMGAFLLMDVPAGTYTVKVVPPAGADYTGRAVPGVVVAEGELTDLGAIQLQ